MSKKNKGGRPTLTKGERSATLGVSVSSSEYEEFMALTKLMKTSKSALWRRIYLEWKSTYLIACVKDPPPPTTEK